MVEPFAIRHFSQSLPAGPAPGAHRAGRRGWGSGRRPDARRRRRIDELGNIEVHDLCFFQFLDDTAMFAPQLTIYYSETDGD